MPSAFPKCLVQNLGLKGPLENIQGSPMWESLYNSGSPHRTILPTVEGTLWPMETFLVVTAEGVVLLASCCRSQGCC